MSGLNDYGRIFTACKRGAVCAEDTAEKRKTRVAARFERKRPARPPSVIQHRATFDGALEIEAATRKNKRRGARDTRAARSL
ncbi:hypothetical protein [Paraburkholderia diazotrophica]|uniref:hypothetical protein n=1 Tax=Paraburkholderia diazotrophica TaxID=667676 RepID=UPI00317B06EA